MKCSPSRIAPGAFLRRTPIAACVSAALMALVLPSVPVFAKSSTVFEIPASLSVEDGDEVTVTGAPLADSVEVIVSDGTLKFAGDDSTTGAAGFSGDSHLAIRSSGSVLIQAGAADNVCGLKSISGTSGADTEIFNHGTVSVRGGTAYGAHGIGIIASTAATANIANLGTMTFAGGDVLGAAGVARGADGNSQLSITNSGTLLIAGGAGSHGLGDVASGVGAAATLDNSGVMTIAGSTESNGYYGINTLANKGATATFNNLVHGSLLIQGGKAGATGYGYGMHYLGNSKDDATLVSTGTINNAGYMEITGGSDSTTFGIDSVAIAAGTGTINNLSSGTLKISGETASAVYKIATHANTAGTITNAGNMTISGGSDTKAYGIDYGAHNAATATIENAGLLTIKGGSGTNAYGIHTGAYQNDASFVLANTGTLVLEAGSGVNADAINNLAEAGTSATVTNSGTVRIRTQGITSGNGLNLFSTGANSTATIENQAGAVFEVAPSFAAGIAYLSSASGSTTINNAGTMNFKGGVGTNTGAFSYGAYNSTLAINNSGNMSFSGGGAVNSDIYDLAYGDSATATLANTGTLTITGGSVVGSEGIAILAAHGATANISNSGTMTVSALVGPGIASLSNENDLAGDTNTAVATITNTGTLRFNGSMSQRAANIGAAGSGVVNESTGKLYISGYANASGVNLYNGYITNKGDAYLGTYAINFHQNTGTYNNTSTGTTHTGWANLFNVTSTASSEPISVTFVNASNGATGTDTNPAYSNTYASVADGDVALKSNWATLSSWEDGGTLEITDVNADSNAAYAIKSAFQSRFGTGTTINFTGDTDESSHMLVSEGVFTPEIANAFIAAGHEGEIAQDTILTLKGSNLVFGTEGNVTGSMGFKGIYLGSSYGLTVQDGLTLQLTGDGEENTVAIGNTATLTNGNLTLGSSYIASGGAVAAVSVDADSVLKVEAGDWTSGVVTNNGTLTITGGSLTVPLITGTGTLAPLGSTTSPVALTATIGVDAVQTISGESSNYSGSLCQQLALENLGTLNILGNPSDAYRGSGLAYGYSIGGSTTPSLSTNSFDLTNRGILNIKGGGGTYSAGIYYWNYGQPEVNFENYGTVNITGGVRLPEISGGSSSGIAHITYRGGFTFNNHEGGQVFVTSSENATGFQNGSYGTGAVMTLNNDGKFVLDAKDGTVAAYALARSGGTFYLNNQTTGSFVIRGGTAEDGAGLSRIIRYDNNFAVTRATFTNHGEIVFEGGSGSNARAVEGGAKPHDLTAEDDDVGVLTFDNYGSILFQGGSGRGAQGMRHGVYGKGTHIILNNHASATLDITGGSYELSDYAYLVSSSGLGIFANHPNAQGNLTNAGTVNITGGSAKLATGAEAFVNNGASANVENSGVFNITGGSAERTYGMYVMSMGSKVTTTTFSNASNGTLNFTGGTGKNSSGVYQAAYNSKAIVNLDNSGTINFMGNSGSGAHGLAIGALGGTFNLTNLAGAKIRIHSGASSSGVYRLADTNGTVNLNNYGDILADPLDQGGSAVTQLAYNGGTFSMTNHAGATAFFRAGAVDGADALKRMARTEGSLITSATIDNYGEMVFKGGDGSGSQGVEYISHAIDPLSDEVATTTISNNATMTFEGGSASGAHGALAGAQNQGAHAIINNNENATLNLIGGSADIANNSGGTTASGIYSLASGGQATVNNAGTLNIIAGSGKSYGLTFFASSGGSAAIENTGTINILGTSAFGAVRTASTGTASNLSSVTFANREGATLNIVSNYGSALGGMAFHATLDLDNEGTMTVEAGAKGHGILYMSKYADSSATINNTGTLTLNGNRSYSAIRFPTGSIINSGTAILGVNAFGAPFVGTYDDYDYSGSYINKSGGITKSVYANLYDTNSQTIIPEAVTFIAADGSESQDQDAAYSHSYAIGLKSDWVSNSTWESGGRLEISDVGSGTLAATLLDKSFKEAFGNGTLVSFTGTANPAFAHTGPSFSVAAANNFIDAGYAGKIAKGITLSLSADTNIGGTGANDVKDSFGFQSITGGHLTTVASGKTLQLTGASASTVVSDGNIALAGGNMTLGSRHVSSGGSLKNITVGSASTLAVEAGAFSTKTVATTGRMTVAQDASIKAEALNISGAARVMNKGVLVADSVTITGGTLLTGSILMAGSIKGSPNSVMELSGTILVENFETAGAIRVRQGAERNLVIGDAAITSYLLGHLDTAQAIIDAGGTVDESVEQALAAPPSLGMSLMTSRKLTAVASEPEQESTEESVVLGEELVGLDERLAFVASSESGNGTAEQAEQEEQPAQGSALASAPQTVNTTLDLASDVSVDTLGSDTTSQVNIGNESQAAVVSVNTVKPGITVYIDPVYEDGMEISDASGLAVKNAGVVASNLIVGQNAWLGLNATEDETKGAFEQFASITEKKWGDVKSFVFVGGNTAVTTGFVLADPTATATSTLPAGTVEIRAGAGLMLAQSVMLTGETLTVDPDNATVVVVGAKDGDQPFLFQTITNEFTAWTNALTQGTVGLDGRVTNVRVTDAHKVSGLVIPNVTNAIIANSTMWAGFAGDAQALKEEANRIADLGFATGAQERAVSSAGSVMDALESNTLTKDSAGRVNSVWVSVHGDQSKAKHYGLGNSGFKVNESGATLGYDRSVSENSVIGIAATFGKGSLKGRNGASGIKNSFEYAAASVYGGYAIGSTRFIGSASVIQGKNEVTGQDFGKINPKSTTAALGIRVEHAFRLSDEFTLTPHAGIRFIHSETDLMKAGGFSYKPGDANVTQFPVGLDIGYAKNFSEGKSVKASLDLTATPAAGGKARMKVSYADATDSVKGRIASGKTFSATAHVEATLGAHSFGVDLGAGAGNGGRTDKKASVKYRYSF